MLRLTMLVHGDAGTGKSWLGASAPGPRLMFDAEGRALYTPGHKIDWDPRQPLPEGITADTTVVINVREFADFDLGYKTLAKGGHPFKSVIIDSLTELQQRCMDKILNGTGQAQTQDWGDLLREMDHIVRKMRDLRTHPTCPIDALVVVALSQDKNGKQRPMLQGQLSLKVAGYFDLVGYMTLVLDGQGLEERRMLIKPIGLIEAKDNTHILGLTYGATIVNPNVAHMLYYLNQPAPEAASV